MSQLTNGKTKNAYLKKQEDANYILTKKILHIKEIFVNVIKQTPLPNFMDD